MMWFCSSRAFPLLLAFCACRVSLVLIIFRLFLVRLDYKTKVFRFCEQANARRKDTLSMVLHVVVGSGAAGCVAAVSLLEGGHDVLLIERGPFRGWEPHAYGAADCTCSDEGTRGSTLHTAPISWGDAAYSGDSAHSVQHDTAPQAGLSRRVVVYPQGRGLGGSMGINAMIWSAGHRAVFDDLWPVGWGSDTIDRYLQLR